MYNFESYIIIKSHWKNNIFANLVGFGRQFIKMAQLKLCWFLSSHPGQLVLRLDYSFFLVGTSMVNFILQVIWGCLVEDSALFLRHVLERLTRDHQDEMFKLLRHLIRFIPRLPQQAAFALYNYIIGYVMFYVRSPHEDGQRLIGAALSILWMVSIFLILIVDASY